MFSWLDIRLFLLPKITEKEFIEYLVKTKQCQKPLDWEKSDKRLAEAMLEAARKQVQKEP